ncbi:hypothetical protein [Hanstruepera ponticola]|uniref:hypothetical protein n=1 Tax=Hanstruepera ponticola TaxID=2042995 RepID=UPI00178011A5|nr:hypothetical protein [Hanstruepera ponticola]
MLNWITNTNLRFILGIPLILLVLSLLFYKSNDSEAITSDFNPYYPKAPLDYGNVLFENRKNDSTFFSAIIEKYGSRELIVAKASTQRQDLESDFDIQLHSIDPKASIINLSINNSGVIYNYNQKSYCVFRKALPFINFNTASIKKKTYNKFQEKWFDTISNSLKAVAPQLINQSAKPIKSVPNPYTSLFQNHLNAYDIQYLPTFYYVENDSLFSTRENVTNYSKNSGATIGLIKNTNAFFQAINDHKSLLDFIDFKGEQSKLAIKLCNDFAASKISLDKFIAIDKLANYMALFTVYANKIDDTFYLIYNKDTNLLEPFFVSSSHLGKTIDYLEKPLINDLKFQELYIKTLEELSNQDIFNSLLNDIETFEKELVLINSYYPKVIFDFDILKINQRGINSNLYINKSIKPELVSIDNKKIELLVSNISHYPIQINGLNYENKLITELNPKQLLLSGNHDTIRIDLPQSFQNLFVSKKNKQTGFILHKHIFDLNISYTILGLNNSLTSTILPYTERETIEDDLFRNPKYINNHSDIVVSNDTISFKNKNVTISEPLVIPSDHIFKIEKGTVIDILEGGKIISHSPLNFQGTADNPIVFESTDNKGQGLLILSDQKQSILNYVEFNNLRNPIHQNWSVTGAVTFYESPVKLNHISIKGNKCEDALNVVRAKFIMTNSSISETQSDAFDGDFVNGTIKNCRFDNLGNDAIDVSGSDLIVDNVYITNAGDKGLSAGEDSRMTIINVEVSQSEIAVAGKDLSIVKIENLKIYKTKLAFTAFQKKPEFGPSNITVNIVKMTDVETKYLIENTSSLIVDGQKIESTENVKDRMYGVEFGRSSAETRNSQ